MPWVKPQNLHVCVSVCFNMPKGVSTELFIYVSLIFRTIFLNIDIISGIENYISVFELESESSLECEYEDIELQLKAIIKVVIKKKQKDNSGKRILGT